MVLFIFSYTKHLIRQLKIHWVLLELLRKIGYTQAILQTVPYCIIGVTNQLLVHFRNTLYFSYLQNLIYCISSSTHHLSIMLESNANKKHISLFFQFKFWWSKIFAPGNYFYLFKVFLELHMPVFQKFKIPFLFL